MSQIRYTSGDFEVLTGWDRPCQSHFLLVGRASEGEQIYCNLDDPSLPPPCGGMTKEQVLQKLKDLGIYVPEELDRTLHEHQSGNYGNLLVDWGHV